MQPINLSSIAGLTLITTLIGACAQSGSMTKESDATPIQPAAQAPAVVAAAPPPVTKKPDPMSDVPGDKPLPPAKGAVERADCATGSGDLHRIAFEVRGRQVTYFTYYNKWQLRTCSLELTLNAPGTKWRLTSDGATRVHTPDGRFVIRARSDGYDFEFQDVSRRNYCSAAGQMNGTVTFTRAGTKRGCTVSGFANAGDS